VSQTIAVIAVAVAVTVVVAIAVAASFCCYLLRIRCGCGYYYNHCDCRFAGCAVVGLVLLVLCVLLSMGTVMFTKTATPNNATGHHNGLGL
jgi:hypothetical protein